jgi:hypothetical protein
VPEPIVILGTGRSFTSVICCMIGQHPDLIGLPETNIFRDPTLGQLFRRFNRGPNLLRRAGLLRTLAYFHEGEQTEEAIDAAEIFVLEHETWTSTEIARYIAGLAAPRGIVEKSISTSREAATLARARKAWPNAYFLHITRQPEDIVRSMKQRIDGAREKGKGGWQLQNLLEAHSLDEYYTRYTTTILEFMATLPPGRGMNLHGEHFLTDARPYCRQICEWLGLDSSDAIIERMMHPEDNPFAHRGPQNALGGMNASFLDNPTYSGKPVEVRPIGIDADDPGLDAERRTMVLLGHRLGYT